MASERRTCRWCRHKVYLWWADLHVCTKEAAGPVVVWPERTACGHFEGVGE